MKPYITAYKVGASTPTITDESLVYWFRPTPKDVKCSNDSLGPPRGYELLHDVVFVTTMLTEPADLVVKSGTEAEVTTTMPAGIQTSNFTKGVGQQSFELRRGGVKFLGGVSEKQIVNSCEKYNYNAYVGAYQV